MLSLRPILLCLFICAIFAGTAKAATPSYTVKYKDSVTVTDELSSVLYNNLEITNNSAAAITLHLAITTPQDWKSLAGREMDITIAPGTTETIPFNFLFAKNAPASFQEVILKVSPKGTQDITTYKYHLRNLERVSFRANSVSDDQFLEDKPEVVKLGLYLKNTGNVTTGYNLHYNYHPLEIDKMIIIKLPPGKDTTYYYPLKVSKHHWKQMYQESIGLSIRDDKGNVDQLVYPLSRSRDEVLQNSSAYTGPMLTLDGGGFINNMDVSYFWGFRLGHTFGYHKFDFSYRSRMYSNNNFRNNIQNNIFLLNYRFKNFILKAGTFNEQNYFLSYGNSLSLGYINEAKGQLFKVTGTRPNKNFLGTQNGDNLSVEGKYRLGRLGMRHIAEANFDTARGVNGYVAGTEVSFVNGTKLRVTGKGAVSTQEFTGDTTAQSKMGYGLGYNASFTTKKLNILSYVDYFSNSFVSYRRGSLSMAHFANWYFTDKFYAGPMYNKVILKTNLFTDTVYNSDIFTYNITKYGMQAGWVGKVHNTRVSAGRMYQTGIFANAGQGEYNYFDVMSNINVGRGNRFNVNSTNGFRKVNSENLWVGSHSLSYSVRSFGFNAAYTKYSALGEGKRTVETVNGGPYVSLRMFRNTTMLNVNLNVGKTSTDSFVRMGSGYTATYNNRKSGTRANITGYIPFTNYISKNVPFNEMRYVNFMVSQDIHLPIKQRYYDIKVVLYNDENNNSILDEGEEMLKNIPVEINDNMLVSNEEGQVKYKNLKTGEYKVGVYKGSMEEGLIASNGPEQRVHLFAKDELVVVPFKRGKVISGNVRIVQDLANTSQFSQQFIKIEAVDSLDRVYTTLTDENGDFYLYVPEGKFKVSISASSFTKDIKPSISNYEVNLAENENVYVSFELKQKKRQIRFREAAIAQTLQTEQPAPPIVKTTETQQPVNEIDEYQHANKRHQ